MERRGSEAGQHGENAEKSENTHRSESTTQEMERKTPDRELAHAGENLRFLIDQFEGKLNLP